MKKLMIVLALSLVFMIYNAAYANIDINISASNLSILDSNTIRIHNFTVVGFPGRYWVDFKWNPAGLDFVPINAGVETGKIWTFVYNSTSDKSYTMTLATDPNTRTMKLTFTNGINNTVICPTSTFMFYQGSDVFDLTTASYATGLNIALFTAEGSWNGCDTLFQGLSFEGAISYIPNWFDFNSSFSIAPDSSGTVFTLDSNGLVHQCQRSEMSDGTCPP
jgi:hypothetical protein